MMRHTLVILISMLAVFVSAPDIAATQRGEKSVGLRTGYNTRNESALAGIWFQYSFSSHFRLAPNADYVFRKSGTDGFSFNLNAHFPLRDAGCRFNVYPLAGIGYISMTHHAKNEQTEDVTTRTNKMGLNIGAGAEFMCTPSLKLYLEGKFNWVTHFNSGVFAIGIGYVF